MVAGTAVLTTLGKKAIEDIRIGDKIPCVDHITGEESEKRVVATSVNKTDKLVELEIGGEIIRCTETHPFQVKDKGWVDAAELVPGDMVYTKCWRTAAVERVNLLEFAEPVEIFNFEVEDCHTYYIGDGCWLVHNLGCNNLPDYQTSATRQKRIKFGSERQARFFARTKVGHNPNKTGLGKLVSRNGKWQYRAKPCDINQNHIHLERLFPRTGEVPINYHLWWE